MEDYVVLSGDKPTLGGNPSNTPESFMVLVNYFTHFKQMTCSNQIFPCVDHPTY